MRKWIAAMAVLALAGVAAACQPSVRTGMPVSKPERASGEGLFVRVYDLGESAGHVDVGSLTGLVATSVGSPVAMLSESCFAVTATAEQHAMVEQVIKSLQEQRSAELYRVELVAYEVPAEKPPALGAPAQVDKAMVRVLHNLTRGRKTDFQATVRQTYIAEWQPVVADNSVGYQPVVKTVSSGLEAVVVVAGSGEQLDLDVTGRISKADVKMVEQPLVSGANLTMGLPVTQERSVQARTRIKPGVLTVISVTESLQDAGSLVIAARIDRAP